MMNIAETKNKVDSVLADRGLVREYKEQAVRLLLYHLYIAIDIYRFMGEGGVLVQDFQGFLLAHWLLKRAKKKTRQRKIPPAPLL